MYIYIYIYICIYTYVNVADVRGALDQHLCTNMFVYVHICHLSTISSQSRDTIIHLHARIGTAPQEAVVQRHCGAPENMHQNIKIGVHTCTHTHTHTRHTQTSHHPEPWRSPCKYA